MLLCMHVRVHTNANNTSQGLSHPSPTLPNPPSDPSCPQHDDEQPDKEPGHAARGSKDGAALRCQPVLRDPRVRGPHHALLWPSEDHGHSGHGPGLPVLKGHPDLQDGAGQCSWIRCRACLFWVVECVRV